MSDNDTDNRVPIARLHQATAKLEAAQARVAELEGQKAELAREVKGLRSKAESHDSLVATTQEQAKAIKALETARAEDLAIVRAGFDDVELVRFEHGRAGKDAGSIPDWLEGLRKGKASDAPANLQRYLEPPATTTETEGETKPKAGGTTRTSNAGSPGTAPGGDGARTQEQFAALVQEAQSTGDWSRYMEARGIKRDA